MAALLPASIGLPPPIPITAFAPSFFAVETASSIEVVVGLGVTLLNKVIPTLYFLQAAST